MPSGARPPLHAVARSSGERHVAVADEDDRARRRARSKPAPPRRSGRTPRSDRAGCRGRGPLPARRRYGSSDPRYSRSSDVERVRVQRAANSASGENRRARRTPSAPRSWLPDEADVRMRRDDRAARGSAGPVADDVAEAPDRVGPLVVDRREHGLEGVEVGVDVGDRRRCASAAANATVYSQSRRRHLGGGGVFLLADTGRPRPRPPNLEASSFFAAADARRGSRASAGSTRWLWVGIDGPRARRSGAARPGGAGSGSIVSSGAPVCRLAPGFAVALAVAAGLLARRWVATLPLGRVAALVVPPLRALRAGLPAPGSATEPGRSAVTTVIVVARCRDGRLPGRSAAAGAGGSPAAPALAVLGVLVVLAQPLVIEPLFNRFSPLARPAAGRADRADRSSGSVSASESVEVSDASRRTTSANAKVTGIGPTRHVILYDTLLDGRFTETEIAWIGRARARARRAQPRLEGRGWFALFAIPGLGLIAWVAERRGGLRDPALVPLALALAFALSVVTLPAQNAISRRYEAEADWSGAPRDRRSARRRRRSTEARHHRPHRPGSTRLGEDRARLASDDDGADRHGAGVRRARGSRAVVSAVGRPIRQESPRPPRSAAGPRSWL